MIFEKAKNTEKKKRISESIQCLKKKKEHRRHMMDFMENLQ